MKRSLVTFGVCFLLGWIGTSCARNHSKPPQKESSTLRIASPVDPSSLDPRMARDRQTIIMVRLLFSGLTWLNARGDVEPELAQSIEVSPDGYFYRIVLKKTVWSDGVPVTAHDFVYSWKSMLDARRAAPNASQLFWIKNAKAAFEGKVAPEEIGLKALSDQELKVELDHPCPFFEKVLATPAFLAVQMRFDQAGGAIGKDGAFPTNGPFRLQKWVPQTCLELMRNKNYVFAEKISQDRMHIAVVEDATALNMFEANELDWAGLSMGTIPPDAIGALKEEKLLHVLPAAGTAFLRVNVTRSPLSDVRLRRACSLSIDRQAIVEHILQGGQLPAVGLVPPCLFQRRKGEPDSLEMARQLLSDYCTDHGCKAEEISISILFGVDGRSLKVATAVQQDLMSKLHINVQLQPCESQHFFSKISKLDYDVALGSWYADYVDPHSFYAVFERAANGTNNTGWESQEYQALLAQSSLTKENREVVFEKMEQLLAAELPIIPLYHGSFNYVMSPAASKMYLSPLGHLELQG